MKNVVIPVDFSETAALAGKFGTYLALLLNCNLEIAYVTDLVLSGEHSLTTPEQRRDEKKYGEQLTKFTQDNIYPVIKANHGRTSFEPDVKLTVLSGIAAKRILSLSWKEDTAFIVMGGVGAGAGLQLPGLYGSVATPVVQRGGCPVILIPKGYAGPISFERVAIAFDDAEEIIRIGQFSRSIVETLKPEVRYVHVKKSDWREEFKNEDDFIDLTMGRGVPSYIYKFDALPEGDVAEQLSRYAIDNEISLLILGGKRQGFWKRLLDKNNLKPIIKACSVPMLVIPFSVTDEEEEKTTSH